MERRHLSGASRPATGSSTIRRSHTWGEQRVQSFTAIGKVRDGMPYQVEMSAAFRPWRRDVEWSGSHEVPIKPLLSQLAFARDDANWGYRFRFGLFEIIGEDADVIAAAMRPIW